jgi:hypothetical protein
MSSHSLTRTAVFDRLDVAMKDRGWLLYSFSALPKVFARDNLVTPFYLVGDIHRTSDGWYALGGAVGVIHKKFEEAWAERKGIRAKGNELGAALLIANIKELREAAYVRVDAFEQGIEEFAASLSKYLSKMPQTESELITAFAAPLFCGKPLEHFAGWSNRQKLSNFREFVDGLRNA